MINNMLIKIILDVGRVESKKINKILLDLLKKFTNKNEYILAG